MAYVKGRAFEYRIKHNLERDGFTVFRFAGSKPLDLVALKHGKILFCECKTYVPTNEDREKAGAWSATLGFPVCLFWKNGSLIDCAVYEPKLNVANNVYEMLDDFIQYLLENFSCSGTNDDAFVNLSDLDSPKAIWGFLKRR